MIAAELIGASLTSREREHAYLHPGQLLVSVEPTHVTTILGSCVAVCLHEPGERCAGVNHFLLPSAPTTAERSARYGDSAVDELVERMAKAGAMRSRLVAKLFGGANVLQAFAEGSRHIGAANVEMARSALSRHGIRIDAEDVGGTRGRKLVYAAPEGIAWVKVLGP